MVCQCLDLPLSASITLLKGQLQRSHGHLVDHLQNTTLKSVRCSGETDKFSTTIYKKYYKTVAKVFCTWHHGGPVILQWYFYSIQSQYLALRDSSPKKENFHHLLSLEWF